MEIRIDPEFKALIPALAECERMILEENLQSDGCRDPLVTWNGLIVDGHNRYEICERLGIGYRRIEREFSDRDAVKIWIIQNQFGRRNLNDFQRAELALTLKPLVEAKATGRMKAGKPADADPGMNSRQGRTADTIAKQAGISEDTIRKTEKIRDAAPEVAEMARAGTVSIDAAAKVATLPKDEQKAVAAAGPKAVKAKAAQVRSEARAAKKAKAAPAVEMKPEPGKAASEAKLEPEFDISPEDEGRPYAEFNGRIRGVVSELRSARNKLGKILEADPTTKRLASRWAHYFSHAGTVGHINALVRTLERGIPSALDEKQPGYLSVQVVSTRESMNKGR